MANSRYEIKIDDGTGRLVGFSLANDPKTNSPLFSTEIMTPVQQATQTVGEVGYANFLPHVNGVFNQPDLSDGMGVKYQRTTTDPLAKRYYYCDWCDASVPGQVQKGAAVTTLAAPANSGAMSGYYELAGVPYLNLGRIVAKWNSGSNSLTQVRDLGAGGVNAGSAVYGKDGTEALQDTSTATGATDKIDTLDKRIAQQIRFTPAGVQFLGRIDLLLQRIGLATPATPVITNVGAAGAVTYAYKVSATSTGGETPVSAAGSTATGNATLSATNNNVVSWVSIPGATGYKIYRTTGGGNATTTGYIGANTSSQTTFTDFGIVGDGGTPNATDTSPQVAGDVRLTVQADLNGAPSNQILSSSTIAALSLSATTPTIASFRFDDSDQYALVNNEPFWIVMDVAQATLYQYVQWTRSTTDNYTRGTGAVSSDGGSSWTNNATSTDYYFNLYAKASTETAFIGADDSTNLYATTTDSSSFTANTYRSSSLFCTVADHIVRDVRAGGRGCIQYSTDGTNWSEALPIGDPNTQITNMVAMGKSLIVCKTDSIWAVDVVDATITAVNMIQLYYSTPIATNGLGAAVWKGITYIPFNGRLIAVEGDFVFGWQVHQNIGPESLDDWDYPWGAGQVVAVAPSRFHLYAIMSTSGAYKLFKTEDAINKKWHGSLCDIGDGSQSITQAHIFDPGGTSNPRLFCSTTSNNVAVIVLSRFLNPAPDPNYLYDTAHTGKLFYPRANANFHVNPKAWVSESVTFQKQTAGDYAEMLYDTLDGEGFRRLGRVYNTDVLPYPVGLNSLLLDRQLNIVNSTTTASPLILTSALTYAVRNHAKVPLKAIEFTVETEDGQSAGDLGDLILVGSEAGEALAQTASISGGTRALIGPDGELYASVLFRNAKRTLLEVKSVGGNRWSVQVSGVQVG